MAETWAITLDPVRAALVAHGVTGWTTWPANAAGLGKVDVGDEVLVGAGAKLPITTQMIGRWLYEAGADEMYHYDDVDREIPVVTRAVVARAVVGAVVPIVEWAEGCDPGLARFIVDSFPDEPHIGGLRQIVEERIDGSLASVVTNLSDHLPYADWSPGRVAVRLDDVVLLDEAVTEYDCPNQASYEEDEDHWLLCCHCADSGKASVRGRPGFWTPDLALVRACGGAG